MLWKAKVIGDDTGKWITNGNVITLWTKLSPQQEMLNRCHRLQRRDCTLTQHEGLAAAWGFGLNWPPPDKPPPHTAVVIPMRRR